MGYNDLGNGTWQGRDGSYHYTEQDAQAHDNATIGGDGNKGGGKGGGGSFLVFFAAITAAFIAFVFKTFSKLGFFGRILQSAAMVFIGIGCWLIIVLPFGELTTTEEFQRIIVEWEDFGTAVGIPLLIAFAIITPVWYFCWHYNTVEEMGYEKFESNIFVTLMFYMYGFIAYLVAVLLFKAKAIGSIILLISGIVGLLIYIIKTRRYARDAAENLSKALIVPKIIATLASIVISVGLGVTWKIEDNLGGKEGKALTAISKNAEAGDVYAIITYVTYADEETGAKIYSEMDYKSSVVSYAKMGEILRITGETAGRKAEFIPVEYKGVKGFIFSSNITGLDAYNALKAKYPVGKIVAANKNPTYLYPKNYKVFQRNDNDPIRVTKRTQLTISGEYEFGWIQVSHDGKNWWVDVERVK